MDTPNKRSLSQISPEQVNVSKNRKVGELDVDDYKMIMREINKEVLEKVSKVSDDVETLKEQNIWLKGEVECLKAEKEMDRKRIMHLEEQLKSKNLLFKGLNVNKSLIDEVTNVCKNNLNLHTTAIKSTRKIFERNGKMTVLAEFDSLQSVQEVLQETRKLKGTSIYIEKDLSVERQQDKKVMLQLRREIRAASTKYSIKVVSDKIKIGSCWMRWNKDKKLVSGDQEAEDVFKKLYGNLLSNINISYNVLLNNSMSKN